MWVLMTKRTRQAYNTVFAKVRELFPEFQPKVAISDFEKGLRRAIQESFGIKKDACLGCWFHFAQVSSDMFRYKSNSQGIIIIN